MPLISVMQMETGPSTRIINVRCAACLLIITGLGPLYFRNADRDNGRTGDSVIH